MLNFQNLQKWQKIKFFTSKNIHGSNSELSIVVLKLPWRIWKNDVEEEPPLHTFLKIFYKTFKILVLSYNLSHFVPIYNEDWQKSCSDIRSLLFLCNEELRKKFAAILIVCQRWRHKEKETGINFVLDVILTGVFFKSYIFWRCFTYFFWSAIPL